MTNVKTEDRIALKFMRFHAPSWMYCDSVDEAVATAYWMIEDGNGWPVEVVSLDGTVLLTEKELDDRRAAYQKKKDVEYVDPAPVAPIPDDDAAAALAFARFMGMHAASPSDWRDLPDDVKVIWRDKAALNER